MYLFQTIPTYGFWIALDTVGRVSVGKGHEHFHFHNSPFVLYHSFVVCNFIIYSHFPHRSEEEAEALALGTFNT